MSSLEALPLLLPTAAAFLGVSLHYARRQQQFAAGSPAPEPVPNRDDYRPRVDVIVPCLNEDFSLLAQCLRSIREQDYEGDLVQVYIVDDGSLNVAQLEPLYREYATRFGWTVIRFPENLGKRRAQRVATTLGFGDLILMVDSDTVIEPDGLSQIVARFARDEVGSVCSNISVLNAETNWLTRAQARRYDLLFNGERAAQGRFGAVLCCAGPFAMFRRDALEKKLTIRTTRWRSERATVLEHYLAQRPWYSQRISYNSGDDLHLTHLVLLASYRSEYEPAAIAHTEVPSTLSRFLRQQLRWNRSLYRELPWTGMVLRRKHDRYLRLDVYSRALLPLLLWPILILAALCLVATENSMVQLVAAAVGGGLLTGHYFALPSKHRRVGFYLGYGAIYLLALVPVKFYAVLTPLTGTWGTRQFRPQRGSFAKRVAARMELLRRVLAARGATEMS